MLAQTNRLSARQVEAVIKGGKVFHSPNFTLRFLALKTGQAKIAAVAPAKAVKKAVQRNRMRRLIYEAVRPLLPGLKNDVQTIVLAKSSAVNLNLTDISKELAGLFEKAVLLR